MLAVVVKAKFSYFKYGDYLNNTILNDLTQNTKIIFEDKKVISKTNFKPFIYKK